MTSESFPTHLS